MAGAPAWLKRQFAAVGRAFRKGGEFEQELSSVGDGGIGLAQGC